MILFKRMYQLLWVTLILSFSLMSCITTPQAELVVEVAVDFREPLGDFESAEEERAAIFALAAYAVVHNDWQTEEEKDSPYRRGHNIGSILVDGNNMPVEWGRNCIAKTGNGTQHGEVRLMQKYLDRTKIEVIPEYTIYTTLEPCAMCSGMMCLVKVSDCVYGQTDGDALRTGYGNAIQRLKLDSRALESGGYDSYPRTPDTSDPSFLPHVAELDKRYSEGTIASITGFLLTNSAKEVFADASEKFYNFTVQYPENESIYAATVALVMEAKEDAEWIENGSISVN